MTTCFAATETFISGSSNDVKTNVFIQNNTSTNYGYIGISLISTVMTLPYQKKTTDYRYIQKYDSAGRILQEKDYHYEYKWINNNWVLDTATNTSMYFDLNAPILMKYLGPQNKYDVSVTSAHPTYYDANYSVTVYVKKIDNNNAPSGTLVSTIVNKFKLSRE